MLSAEAITEFIDGGGNLLISGNANTGEVLREIASECGFEARIFISTYAIASILYLLRHDLSDFTQKDC